MTVEADETSNGASDVRHAGSPRPEGVRGDSSQSAGAPSKSGESATDAKVSVDKVAEGGDKSGTLEGTANATATQQDGPKMSPKNERCLRPVLRAVVHSLLVSAGSEKKVSTDLQRRVVYVLRRGIVDNPPYEWHGLLFRLSESRAEASDAAAVVDEICATTASSTQCELELVGLVETLSDVVTKCLNALAGFVRSGEADGVRALRKFSTWLSNIISATEFRMKPGFFLEGLSKAGLSALEEIVAHIVAVQPDVGHELRTNVLGLKHKRSALTKPEAADEHDSPISRARQATLRAKLKVAAAREAYRMAAGSTPNPLGNGAAERPGGSEETQPPRPHEHASSSGLAEADNLSKLPGDVTGTASYASSEIPSGRSSAVYPTAPEADGNAAPGAISKTSEEKSEAKRSLAELKSAGVVYPTPPKDANKSKGATGVDKTPLETSASKMASRSVGGASQGAGSGRGLSGADGGSSTDHGTAAGYDPYADAYAASRSRAKDARRELHWLSLGDPYDLEKQKVSTVSREPTPITPGSDGIRASVYPEPPHASSGGSQARDGVYPIGPRASKDGDKSVENLSSRQSLYPAGGTERSSGSEPARNGVYPTLERASQEDEDKRVNQSSPLSRQSSPGTSTDIPAVSSETRRDRDGVYPVGPSSSGVTARASSSRTPYAATARIYPEIRPNEGGESAKTASLRSKAMMSSGNSSSVPVSMSVEPRDNSQGRQVPGSADELKSQYPPQTPQSWPAGSAPQSSAARPGGKSLPAGAFIVKSLSTDIDPVCGPLAQYEPLQKRQYQGPGAVGTPMRSNLREGGAEESGKRVTFETPSESQRQRGFLEEASTIVQIPSRNEVVHLFSDSCQVLDFTRAPDGLRDEVERRCRASTLNTVLALHAAVRYRIQKLLAEKDNVAWEPPSQLEVKRPSERSR